MATKLPPRVLRRYRRILQAYHTQTEELVRVLQALEAAGLKTYSVKKVERTHYLLEGYLEQLDSDTFDSRSVARLVAQFESRSLSPYGSDEAFERVSGRAITQMDAVAKAWLQAHNLVFEGPDFEIPVLELEEEERAELARGPEED